MKIHRFYEKAKQLSHLLLRFWIDQSTFGNYFESILMIRGDVGTKIALCETSLHCETIMQRVGEPRTNNLILMSDRTYLPQQLSCSELVDQNSSIPIFSSFLDHIGKNFCFLLHCWVCSTSVLNLIRCCHHPCICQRTAVDISFDEFVLLR